MEVLVCARRTNIPLAGSCGFKHVWLVTDRKAVGRGTRNKLCNSCPCALTRMTDHTAEPTNDCVPAEDWINRNDGDPYDLGDYKCAGKGLAKCVNKAIDAGRPLGPFIPFANDCRTLVLDVLRRCCTYAHKKPIYGPPAIV